MLITKYLSYTDNSRIKKRFFKRAKTKPDDRQKLSVSKFDVIDLSIKLIWMYNKIRQKFWLNVSVFFTLVNNLNAKNKNYL